MPKPIKKDKLTAKQLSDLKALGYKGTDAPKDLMTEANAIMAKKGKKYVTFAGKKLPWWVAEKNKIANSGKDIVDVLVDVLTTELPKKAIV